MRGLCVALPLVALVVGSAALACSNDTDCKGDRICDQGVCVAPAAGAASGPAAVPLVSTSSVPASAPPSPTVLVVPALPPVEPPVPPAPTAPAVPMTMTGAAAPASSVTQHSSSERIDGNYTPSLGFRCLVAGESACAFQLRALAFLWQHSDLHADLLLGGFQGGDVGVGVGTAYWRLGEASAASMLFRWDFDALVVQTTPTVGNTLLEVALESGPRFGFSYALTKEVALEAALNGGLVLGYGVAQTTGGTSQLVLDAYLGLLLGVRL